MGENNNDTFLKYYLKFVILVSLRAIGFIIGCFLYYWDIFTKDKK